MTIQKIINKVSVTSKMSTFPRAIGRSLGGGKTRAGEDDCTREESAWHPI